MHLNKVWIGSAVKVGGHLAVIGGESFRGSIVRADAIANPQAYWTICSTAGWRFGLGLGGGTNIIGVLVLNANFPTDFHNLDISGWGVNVAFPGFKKPNISPELYPIFQGMAKGLKFADDKNKLNMMTNFINSLSGLADAAQGNVKPIAFIFDIPFAGWGVELSFGRTVEYKLQVQDYLTWKDIL